MGSIKLFYYDFYLTISDDKNIIILLVMIITMMGMLHYKQREGRKESVLVAFDLISIVIWAYPRTISTIIVIDDY